ncbi:16289_t:CDS:2, partial [Acaulospora colombiana]
AFGESVKGRGATDFSSPSLIFLLSWAAKQLPTLGRDHIDETMASTNSANTILYLSSFLRILMPVFDVASWLLQSGDRGKDDVVECQPTFARQTL